MSDEGARTRAAWTESGVCVIGTHDALIAAETWAAMVAERWPDAERGRFDLDHGAWSRAQARWTAPSATGISLSTVEEPGGVPALLLVGVFRG